MIIILASAFFGGMATAMAVGVSFGALAAVVMAPIGASAAALAVGVFLAIRGHLRERSVVVQMPSNSPFGSLPSTQEF